MVSPLRLTLSQRVLFALATVLVSATGLAVYIVLSVQSLTRLSVAEQRSFRATEAAYQLDIEVLRVIVLLHQYRDAPDAARLAELEAGRSAAARNRVELRKHTQMPEVLRALERYEDLLPRRIGAAQSIVSAAQAGEESGDVSALIALRAQLDTEARALLRRIIDIEQHELRRILQESAEARNSFRTNVLTALALVMLVITGMLYTIIAGGLTRRLAQLTEMARRVASGDYSKTSFLDSDDEVAALARTFNEMAGQLAQFDKVKEEFVALASHQLRTPATAVKGNIGMLLEGYCGELTAEQVEILNDAYESNERQLKVIDDMLWVARSEADRLQLFLTPTDLTRLTEDVVAEQMPVIQQRQQTIRLDKPAKPTVANLDGQKIRMVFENLLSNACKYTPERGQIRVSLSSDSDRVDLTVSDTGVGIAPEDRAQLFQKFSRISNPLSEAVGGTGLGLYLANEIVKLHGGSIQVDSSPGQGTTFTVHLPRDMSRDGEDIDRRG